MFIHPLGHTEFGIEIANKQGEIVRILIDAWLSDYAFGDLMERTPRIALDSAKIRALDVIYLSHSHCDHFDPYTLVPIYKIATPLLIIPETLEYLVPVLEKYLLNAKIRILRNQETFMYRGIDFHGICFENEAITNEDDVMTLAVSNHEELLYAEIDTVIPKTEEAYGLLAKLFARKSFARVTYLSSRNELGANLPILDQVGESDREKFRKQYRSSRKEEIEWEYEMLTCGELPDFTEVPNFSRGFIGQGICYPSVIDPVLSRTTCMSLIDISELENSIARNYGKDFPSRVLTPGKVFETTSKGLKPIQSESFLGTIITENISSAQTNRGRIYAQWPLRDEVRDFVAQEELLLHLLNNRFLPSTFSNPDDNLKSVLLNIPDRTYRIVVRFGTQEKYEERYYVFSFGEIAFRREISGNTSTKFTFQENQESPEKWGSSYENRVPKWDVLSCTENEERKVWMRNLHFSEIPRCQEDYWANDLEDFWNGSQELYFNFFHLLDLKRTYRLWTMLGGNFFNNDIVRRKYDYHFERASRGETVNGFVEGIISHLVEE